MINLNKIPELITLIFFLKKPKRQNLQKKKKKHSLNLCQINSSWNLKTKPPEIYK